MTLPTAFLALPTELVDFFLVAFLDAPLPVLAFEAVVFFVAGFLLVLLVGMFTFPFPSLCVQS